MFKKKRVYPVKTTLNLMVIERSSAQLKRYLPYIILYAVILAAFTKFGVADRIASVGRAEGMANDAESRLAAVNEQLTDYDEVKEEYTRYFSEALGADSEVMPLDVMEVLSLVEKHLMPKTNISSLKFAADSVTMELTDTGLDLASDLYAELTALPQVAAVSLYTANTGGAASGAAREGATILLTVTFQEVLE